MKKNFVIFLIYAGVAVICAAILGVSMWMRRRVENKDRGVQPVVIDTGRETLPQWFPIKNDLSATNQDNQPVKLSDLRARNRTRAIAFPRQIAMYLSRQLTHASLAEIGRAFGGKDHTTVLHAVEKLQTMLLEDPKLKRTVDTLTQGITL